MPMPMSNLSAAGAQLGLGGIGQSLGLDLQDQVAGLTEEERKRRMAQIAQQRQLGVSGASAAGQSLGLGGSVFGLGGFNGTGLLR
jgi:hypothetical protein